jgi:hypothetical protein
MPTIDISELYAINRLMVAMRRNIIQGHFVSTLYQESLSTTGEARLTKMP